MVLSFQMSHIRKLLLSLVIVRILIRIFVHLFLSFRKFRDLAWTLLQYNYFEGAFIRTLVFIEESGTYFFNTTSIQFSADVDRIWNINSFQRFSQRRRCNISAKYLVRHFSDACSLRSSVSPFFSEKTRIIKL
jgi:hypothetical protein